MTSTVKYVLPDPEEDGFQEIIDQSWDLAKHAGIRILSDKDLSWVAVYRNRVVGAIFTSVVSNQFSFDTIVAPKWQKRGVGSKLIDLGIQEYKQLSWDFPDIEMVLDVVNPSARKILEKKGLVVIEHVAGDRVIMGVS